MQHGHITAGICTFILSLQTTCLGHLVVTADLVGQVVSYIDNLYIHNSSGCSKVHFWFSVAFIQKSYMCMLHMAA